MDYRKLSKKELIKRLEDADRTIQNMWRDARATMEYDDLLRIALVISTGERWLQYAEVGGWGRLTQEQLQESFTEQYHKLIEYLRGLKYWKVMS